MGSSKAITVLHISDLQFGRYHRFGNLAVGDPDARLDSLLDRLRLDLKNLRKGEAQLAPDIVVVSGDLAEWGLRTEFSDAFELLERLTSKLGLPRDRVAVVPGNHDLNRKLCEAYFNECEADEREPARPYARKWEPYLRRFEEFYASGPDAAFTVEEPWSLWEVEELRLVIAGLNSTMRESHREEDHYGWIGERQLRWFAEHLEGYAEKGWFRLGVVHHNPVRGAVTDDENLRDADDLAGILGPSLNLLLHGHTHDGKIGWLGDVPLPVLSTGSAALSQDARPPEVPNQYQVLRLRQGGIDRWARSYDPARKRWIADTSISADGDTGVTSHPLTFRSCAAAFGVKPKRPSPEASEPQEASALERSSAFALEVIEICELRYGKVEPIMLDPRYSYLRVRAKEGNVIQGFPIGLLEGNVAAEDIDGFCRNVFDQYRAFDPNLRCKIVYGGDRPSTKVFRRAGDRNVELNSYVEFQGIIDFRGYLDRQATRLRSDSVYPPDLYVPQGLAYEVGTESHVAEDAVSQLMSWVGEPKARFVLVLGDFGAGKTFMLRELARRMPRELPHLVPMLIELRSLEKARTIEQLVAQHLATAGERFIDLEAFPYMLRQGRIALLVDGFDELAMRVTYKRATEHFDTLLQAAGGDAKVILTSRTQHFESEQQVRSALLERAELLPGLSLSRVQPFDDSQIKAFLKARFEDPVKAKERFALLGEINDLLGLSHNPRMLNFIAQIPEQELREARERSGEITAAEIYRLLIDQWLDYEWEKTQVRGVAPALSVEQRWEAVTELALCLWVKIDRAVQVSELTERVSATVESLGTGLADTGRPDPDAMAHLVGSRTLLVRDDEGAFEFVHASVMEWFVANHAAESLSTGVGPETLGQREMTDLMTAFFCDLAGRKAALAWAREAVDSEEASPARSNALRVLAHLDQEADGAELEGERLSGRNLSGRTLSGAKLKGVELTEARMANVDLRDADLSDADLVRADLTGANLTGAVLKNADLRGARLLGADLRDAQLEGANLRRAKLIGAYGADYGALSRADTFGAALSSSEMPEARLEPVASKILAIACHPCDELVASGHQDGTIRIWDLWAGAQLRSFWAASDRVDDLAFSPDGRLLASLGDSTSLRIWDYASGTQLASISAGESGLRQVAFSGDGRHLAGAGRDGSVRVWDCKSWSERHAFMAHRGWARDVAFSPDGSVLASAGSDDEIKLWSLDRGELIGQLPGHRNGTWCVDFSPDGLLLASGGTDTHVMLWDWRAEKLRAEIPRHRQRVRQVGFSPDGRLLATAGDDFVVRVWNWEAKSLMHELSDHAGHDQIVGFSADGSVLVDVTSSQAIRISDAGTGKTVRQLRSPRPVTASAVAFSPDGQLVASIDVNDDVLFWDARTGALKRVVPKRRSSIRAIGFSPDGQLVATGDESGVIRLFDPVSGREKGAHYGFSGPVSSLSFSQVDQVTACIGGKVCFWDFSKLKRDAAPVLGLGDEVRKVVSPEQGISFATIDQKSHLSLYKDGVDAGPSLLSGTPGAIRDAAFSSDGHRLAGASPSGVVFVWDIQSKSKPERLKGHTAAVSSVAFSAHGRMLASGDARGAVFVWDVETGARLKTLKRSQGAIHGLAFDPTGDQLAAVEADGAITLWDLEDGRARMTIAALPEGWLAFAEDGRYKMDGRIGGSFWFVVGLCRFSPGELDDLLAPSGPRRIALDKPF